MTRVRCAVLLGCGALAWGLLGTSTAQATDRAAVSAPTGQVVVVAVPGLRWSDVTAATPALDRLARTAAAGVLSVKAGPSVSCAADGLLTLGAGARATAYGVACGSGTELAAQTRRNRDSPEQAVVGALGGAVRSAGGCVAANGPLAALATGQPAQAAVTAADCPLVVLQATVIGADGGPRAAGAGAADALVAAADRDRAAGSTLLVVGVSEAPTDRVAHLHVALATGPGFGRGALRSASTGRSPYVQLVDVAPTVLTTLGLAPGEGTVGQPWQVRGAVPSLAALRDLDVRATAQKRATVPFFVVLVAAQLVLLVLLARRRRAAEVVALTGTAAPAASFLAGLVPWWRASHPLAALLLVGAIAAVVLVALAVTATRRRRPGDRVGAVCALTALVVAADLVTGAHLQVSSVTGYSPLVAGRFAGIGNVAFGAYAAAGLVATAWLARGRAAVVAAVGAVLVAVDGAPMWGSDVGGVLALLPALVVLALLVSGRRVGLLRPALGALAAALLVTALALLDAARPERDRTHLGRFARQVRDGEAGGVLRRKADAVLGLLFHSPATAMLPLVVAAAAYLLLRPPPPLARALAATPAYRHALMALGVACALGFVLNDSGAAVPALALVVVLPATVAVVSSLPPGHPDP